MLLRILSLIFVVFTFFSEPVLAEDQDPQGPSLVFKESFYDFGNVERGVILSHDFEFQNMGRTAFKIDGIHAGCGCIGYESDLGKSYAPGAQGKLRVKFDTNNFRGLQIKLITVLTDEKLLPANTLTLKAQLEDEALVIPPMVNFGPIARDAPPPEWLVKIKALKEQPASWLKKPQFNAKVLNVSLKPHPEGWELRVQLLKPFAEGTLKEDISIETGSKYLKQLRIPVRASIAPIYELSPRYVEFGNLLKNTQVQKTVRILSHEKTKWLPGDLVLKVNGIPQRDASSILKIKEIKAEDQLQSFDLALFHPLELKGSVHGKLTLVPENAGPKPVELDFYGFFQE